jgi:putative transposase
LRTKLVLDTSFAFTAHLIEAGIDASIGTVGDFRRQRRHGIHDRPVQTELIKRRGPRRSLADVELATAEYVNWFNTRRLHTAIGGIPPAEHEAAYYAQNQPIPRAGPNNRSVHETRAI